MLTSILLSIILLCTFTNPKNPESELYAFWETMSETVQNGDYDGYAALYHNDAILVSGFTNNSYPISSALAGWKQGFDNTRAGKMKAGVEFRFSKRLTSETTAHESGMFRYWSQNDGEEVQVFLAHFEALLVKKNGKWQMMMEYQISEASDDEWMALK